METHLQKRSSINSKNSSEISFGSLNKSPPLKYVKIKEVK